ncbi:MAG: UDP-N-acetylmuramoyl-L-alanine--D-glutamate ligase, partial [Pseudomonadota bacterium]
MMNVAPFVESLGGQPVAVFGLARSGLSTVRALKDAGVIVYAWDDREEAQDAAKELGANVQPIEEIIADCGCLVLAPGVPLTHPEPHPVVKAAQAADVEILCDIEILYRSIKDIPYPPRLVGITGTNGKSTTTALMTHVLSENKVKAWMGGNIGVPALDLELPEDEGVYV